jgi:hypothetical protein
MPQLLNDEKLIQLQNRMTSSRPVYIKLKRIQIQRAQQFRGERDIATGQVVEGGLEVRVACFEEALLLTGEGGDVGWVGGDLLGLLLAKAVEHDLLERKD